MSWSDTKDKPNLKNCKKMDSITNNGCFMDNFRLHNIYSWEINKCQSLLQFCHFILTDKFYYFADFKFTQQHFKH